MTVKKIALGTLKKQFLFLIDHLDPDGLVITKHGKPVARMLPIERAPTNRVGVLRKQIKAPRTDPSS